MHVPDRYELNAGWALPNAYGVDRLVLLPKDPGNLFAYWEITPELDAKMKAEYQDWDQGRGVLRLHDLETGAVKEVELNGYADNWYIEADAADRTYRLEMGRILPSGRYVPLISSNTVRTPRDSISSVIDPRWRMFAFWQQRYYRRIISGLSSPEILFTDSPDITN
ncbi:MAG: DUF4912 domain-containing protein [Bacillota bacterium]|nr:DUF4912 domain-containing protein [Bacillota bacterium]MDW7683444.1 DUF4912 domain-containing protein [Bacillota bacterium]